MSYTTRQLVLAAARFFRITTHKIEVNLHDQFVIVNHSLYYFEECAEGFHFYPAMPSIEEEIEIRQAPPEDISRPTYKNGYVYCTTEEFALSLARYMHEVLHVQVDVCTEVGFTTVALVNKPDDYNYYLHYDGARDWFHETFGYAYDDAVADGTIATIAEY